MKKNMPNFLLLLLSLMMSCQRQDKDAVLPKRESHTVTEILPNSSVSCFEEDDMGYIWMGLSRGLVRYDGHSFHHYLNDRDNPYSLPSNIVLSIYNDKKGNLWVGTASGLARLNERDEFVPVEFDHSEYRSVSIKSFSETSDGRLFLSTGDIIQEYDKNQSCFVRRLFFDNGKAAYAFFFDPADRIWYLSQGCVHWRETPDSQQEHVYEDAGKGLVGMILLPNSVICTFGPDGFHIWSSELNMPLYHGRIAREGEFRMEDVTSIHPGYQTTFYIITRQNRVFVFDYASGELNQVDAPYGTRNVYPDNDGNIWFGTEKNGFSCVPSNVLTEVSASNTIYSYKGVSVESLSKVNDGQILVNTSGHGVYLCDLDNGKISRLAYERFTQLPPLAVFIDSHQRLWVATSNRCHVLVENARYPQTNSGRIDEIINYHELYSFPTKEGEMFLEDSFGNVWLSTFSHNIYVLPSGASKMQSVRLDVKSGFMYVPELHLSSSGKVMVLAFLYGIFEIDPQTFQVSYAFDIKSMIDFNFYPTCMLEDASGNIWLGTNSNGVFRFDPQRGVFRAMDEIACESIFTLTESSDGSIWAGTANGLYQYSDGQVLHFSNNDNIIEGELTTHAALPLRDGYMLFGSSGGLFVVDPDINEIQREPRLHFDDLFLNGIMVNPAEGGIIEKSLNHLPEVNLPKNAGSLRISFSNPNFVKDRPLDYWYMLEGYDKDWQKVHAGNMVHYSYIPEGKYTLVLQARDRRSGKVRSSISQDINVTSPLLTSRIMVTVIYPLLISLLFVLSLLTYLRYRKQRNEQKRIIQEKENEKNLNKMNVSFFTNMSHEFRTPLTLILGPVAEITEELEDTPYNRSLISTVRNSVNRMLKLVDQIMDFSKLETDALNLSLCRCDIAALFRNYVTPFKYNCTQKGILLEISDNMDGRTMLVDTDKFEKIINNLMSNAVKYTPGGAGSVIRASIGIVTREQAGHLFRAKIESQSEEFCLVSIADTGLGIPEDKREEVFERYRRLNTPGNEKEFGSGIGLYYARRLATLHHGHLEAGDSPFGHGTCFRFLIPASDIDYQGEIIVEGLPSELPENQEYVESPNSNGNGNRPAIMLVEDDVDLASYIYSLLGKYYDVKVKYSADDAINELKYQSPDLVITDVMLPGQSDGLGLCSQIKNNMETCHIPVMILSAKSTLDDQIRGLDTGADSYVVKPVAPAYLLTLTKTLISNREKLRNRISQTTDVSDIPDKDLSPHDRLFLESLYELMEKQLNSAELNVDVVADALKISRSKLYYKFKGLINETPNTFFKKYKLNRAAELIKSGKYNLSEIADMTGFSSLSYFSVSFKKQFGVKPSDYS